MRFSKVDGIRSASLKEGVLYNTKEDKLVDIEKTVIDRIKDANKNYNVFCFNRIVKNNHKFATYNIKSVLNSINQVCNKINNNEINQQKFLDNLINQTQNLSSNSKDDEKNIRRTVNLTLRRGMKIENQTEFLINLIKFLLQKSTDQDKSKFKDENNLNEFFIALETDYNRKVKMKEKITKSIKNQKTNVIVDNKELKLGSTENKNKEPLSLFMKNYVNNSEELTRIFKIIEQDFFKVDINQDKPLPFIDDTKKINEAMSKKISSMYNSTKKSLENEPDSAEKTEKLFWFNKTYQYLINEYTKPKYRSRNFNIKKLTYGYIITRLHGTIKNYITTQFLQLGKAVYHFYDFENGEIYVDNTTSFDFELIKAKDTLCQKVHTSIVFAVHTFINSISNGNYIKNNKKSRITDINGGDITDLNKDNLKFLLRFWGGQSNNLSFNGDVNALATEIGKAIYSIRNNYFHYSSETTPEKNKTKSYPLLCKLYENEISQLSEMVFEKYKTNNVYNFYNEDSVNRLIKDIYSNDHDVNVFIPSFKSVMPRGKYEPIGNVNEDKDKFSSASYFLLKEIYYGDFIHNHKATTYFEQELNKKIKYVQLNYNDKNKKKHLKAWSTFKDEYIKSKTFVKMCEQCVRNYADESTKQDKSKSDKPKGAFYLMFLKEITNKAFVEFYKNEYTWITKPYNNPLAEYPEKINQPDITFTNSISEKMLEWYAVIKFITPKEISLLKGTFMKAQQYKEDILKRAEIVGNEFNQTFYKSIDKYFTNNKEIIKLLDTCQMFAGRMSNNSSDYYKSNEEYAQKLSSYIDYDSDKLNKNDKENYDKLLQFCSYENEEKKNDFKIFIDGANPIIHGTLERATMYGSENVLKNIVTKISKKEFDNYKKLIESENVHYLNNYSDLDTKNYIEEKQGMIRFENRIKLYDVSKLNSLLFDLYSQLVSWCYKWERDYAYFLMGFMYLKDREELKEIKKIHVYGEELGGDQDKTSSLSDKLKDYLKINKQKYDPQRSTLFAMPVKNEKVYPLTIRGDIDHFSLFRGKKYSIFEYYNFMLQMLAYDRKTKNDVMTRFKNILEKYFVEVKLDYIDSISCFNKVKCGKIKSKELIFKTPKEKDDKNKKTPVVANSSVFLKNVENLLKYNS